MNTHSTNIKRHLLTTLKNHLSPGKVVVLYGPRQVGKTTLITELSKELDEQPLWLNGENRDVQAWLSSQSSSVMKPYIDKHTYIFIDEAQNVPRIGHNLKLLVDTFPDKQLVATGSSSFDLANQIGEPLVGRQWQYKLYPISQLELSAQENYMTTEELLPQRLIYGGYPKVVTAKGFDEKKDLLDRIVDSYLFKDILALENLKKPEKLLQLLQLLAFQIGQEVSVSELANKLDINFFTVDRYLDLLEKVWVIVHVSGFSRNLRKEITKNARYYFIDNGIRNAVIQNFNPLEMRNDVGQLWENYLFIERLKRQQYLREHANRYFWRTYDRQELDMVEESGGKLRGYEFKWSMRKQPKPPKSWLETYEHSSYEVVNPKNYLEFIT